MMDDSEDMDVDGKRERQTCRRRWEEELTVSSLRLKMCGRVSVAAEKCHWSSVRSKRRRIAKRRVFSRTVDAAGLGALTEETERVLSTAERRAEAEGRTNRE